MFFLHIPCILQLYQFLFMYPISRGATALLINRTSGKGLIVDSTSANGPLFRNPFLTSTGWCENDVLDILKHMVRPRIHMAKHVEL